MEKATRVGPTLQQALSAPSIRRRPVCKCVCCGRVHHNPWLAAFDDRPRRADPEAVTVGRPAQASRLLADRHGIR
jgi:hypothetical protein